MFKILFSCVPLFFFSSLLSTSQLDLIIPPEIKNDAFYQTIYRLARTENVDTVLEIGSSSGDGSTEAFVLGLLENQFHPTLFCMEVSKPRFEALQARWREAPFVKCYNVSSIPIESFPSKEEVAAFHKNIPTNLSLCDLGCVLGWLEQDIQYIKTSEVPQKGIEIIKTDNHIENFGIVLIDGSEFTGEAEFQWIYGAKFILLDDINTFKNYANYQKLLQDKDYELLEMDINLRNGYAIFKRKSCVSSIHQLDGSTQKVLQFIKPFLPDNPVIIEAGSYNGEDTLQLAQFWPEGKVFAFEPVPELMEQTKRKTCFYPNISCFQKALSDRNGIATFYLSEWGGKVAGSSSLLPPKEHLNCDPSVSFPGVLKIETTTLDEWAKHQNVENIDFLWLDMQGYELNMLKESKLALNASVIYTEVEFLEAYEGQYLYEDITSWMHSNGFQLIATDFDETQIDQEMQNRRYWGNALFIKPQSISNLALRSSL